VMANAAEVVITTKLFRPNPRQQTVKRKRLYDVLRQGRTLPLTLVAAPAGWGKSTLVADWLTRDEGGSDVLRDVLPAFVNELASAETVLVLVLDDYHLVTSAQVHMSVAALLDRSRPSCT